MCLDVPLFYFVFNFCDGAQEEPVTKPDFSNDNTGPDWSIMINTVLEQFLSNLVPTEVPQKIKTLLIPWYTLVYDQIPAKSNHISISLSCTWCSVIISKC